MKISNNTYVRMDKDLQLSAPFVKGQNLCINNCWHFSTNGKDLDAMFYDEADFVDGMNRIYFVSSIFDIVILAFALMDNHVHFVVYGGYDSCNKFVHEYVRRTSMHITERHGERHKMEDVGIDYQVVDDDRYLKTVICYTIKNPPVAGIRSTAYDYPWSSGALYFRNNGMWTSPAWTTRACMRKISSIIPGETTRWNYFHTHEKVPDDLLMYGRMIFPGEYVAYDVVEKIFLTQKSFNYFLCRSKEDDVDLKRSNISFLSIPDQEMRQHKAELCGEMFGEKTVRKLNVNQRIALARTMKAKYNCSLKQIAGLCGINYEDLRRVL